MNLKNQLKLMKVKKIVVHDGVFHADDVFTVAFLKELLNNNVEVIRTRNLDDVVDENTLVADVGEHIIQKSCNLTIIKTIHQLRLERMELNTNWLHLDKYLTNLVALCSQMKGTLTDLRKYM